MKPYKARMWALIQPRREQPVLFSEEAWARAACRRGEKVVRVEVSVTPVKEAKS